MPIPCVLLLLYLLYLLLFLLLLAPRGRSGRGCLAEPDELLLPSCFAVTHKDVAWDNMVWQGTARRGTARRGTARHGAARHGALIWHGMACAEGHAIAHMPY
jgi:hypothetical protein